MARGHDPDYGRGFEDSCSLRRRYLVMIRQAQATVRAAKEAWYRQQM